ncbi:Potassium channel subfamily K member 13 [Bagarius yarrelli]|uniref:Potassium channel subfamily K member 13 n=1 Tax=Bagarius yarrelli TaxID=175774 RepID=A0A556VAL3_BAGYA|nr:Potassium channel subfamily K member 13 [Bagarius yarrelli]
MMAFRGSCCCLGLGSASEDTARFAMLALLILVYLVCGAAVFSALERPEEEQAKGRWARSFDLFSRKHNVSRKELEEFLRAYEEATGAGIRVDRPRARWDFQGAFYFVGTVVSTIATILFFNLFLERIITVLAFVLKSCHEAQHRRKGVLPHDSRHEAAHARQRGEDSLAGWKPSVYCVMLILCVAAIIISCCASAMYSSMEGWGYLDSLYFCFVAFSTIGFGDMVSGQRVAYDNQTLYSLGNFIFILTGACCIYSLFNVISIVIKQVLNWLLKKLKIPCHHCPGRNLRPGRNAIMPGHFRTRIRNISIDTDAVNESETDGRRMSGEMISMRDFLAANKVNLAIMQKQLSETANGYPRPSGSANRHDEFSGGVGALGIMNNRLAETSVDR